MIDLLKDKQPEIAAFCQHYRIRKLEVFGSAATGAFNPESSDIDFLVDLGEYDDSVADRYLDLAIALEALLGRSIDLITTRAIKNPYFQVSVNRHRETVYDAGDRQAAA